MESRTTRARVMPRRGRERASIQVIARAAQVLRALEGAHEGMSLAQIAGRVGLARSTVKRIVDALSDEHLLIAATPRAGVRLGPALIRLAASARVEFDDITRPLLLLLSQRVGETVDLSMLKGHVAVFTDQVQGAHRLRAVSAVGDTFPLHCTANGKALLSLLNAELRAQLLRGRLTRLTARTIVQRPALLESLEAIRRSGLAYDLEEHTEGICAVGTALLDPVGRPLAISIPVPATRFARLRPLLSREILKTRARMLTAFGGSPARLAE